MLRVGPFMCQEGQKVTTDRKFRDAFFCPPIDFSNSIGLFRISTISDVVFQDGPRQSLNVSRRSLSKLMLPAICGRLRPKYVERSKAPQNGFSILRFFCSAPVTQAFGTFCYIFVTYWLYKVRNFTSLVRRRSVVSFCFVFCITLCVSYAELTWI